MTIEITQEFIELQYKKYITTNFISNAWLYAIFDIPYNNNINIILYKNKELIIKYDRFLFLLKEVMFENNLSYSVNIKKQFFNFCNYNLIISTINNIH